MSDCSDVPESPCFLTPHQVRQLNAQVNACGNVAKSMSASHERLLVMEVFSHPPVTPVAESVSLTGKSYMI